MLGLESHVRVVPTPRRPDTVRGRCGIPVENRSLVDVKVRGILERLEALRPNFRIDGHSRPESRAAPTLDEQGFNNREGLVNTCFLFVLRIPFPRFKPFRTGLMNTMMNH